MFSSLLQLFNIPYACRLASSLVNPEYLQLFNIAYSMHALIVSNKYGLGKELKLFQQVANGEKLKMLRFQGQKTARKEIIARLSEDEEVRV